KGRRPAGAAPGWRCWWSGCGSAGRQRLAGALGKAPEGLCVADRDVREDLAVQLDPGELESVHQLRVGQLVLARRGVDPGDPQAAEVTLAVATVAVAVLVGLEHRLLGDAVVPARVAPVTLGEGERGPALLACVDPTLDPGHRLL